MIFWKEPPLLWKKDLRGFKGIEFRMIKNLRKKVFSQLHGRENTYIGLSKIQLAIRRN